MNSYLKKRRAVGLIIVLGFLLIVSALAFAVLVLFQSQHGITYSFMGLDEIRYAEEMGFRHGLWVWRYKYGDPDYFVSRPECIAQPDGRCYIETFTFSDEERNVVNSIRVHVEDINADRQLNLEDEPKDIDVSYVKKVWTP